MVRAKFFVDRVMRQINDGQEFQTVILRPVHGEGEIQLVVTQPEAADQFVLDAEYAVDFTRVS